MSVILYRQTASPTPVELKVDVFRSLRGRDVCPKDWGVQYAPAKCAIYKREADVSNLSNRACEYQNLRQDLIRKRRDFQHSRGCIFHLDGAVGDLL